MNNQFSHISYFKALRGSLFAHISQLFLGICLLFISACSLFKERSFSQADSLLRFRSNRELKTNSTTHSKMIRISVSSDSSDKQYEAEIFPKGIFTYSPGNGFNGEAERVVLKGKLKEGKLVRDSVQFTVESNLRSERWEAEQAKMQTRRKEKEIKIKDNRLTVLVGCLVLAVVLLFVFRRFFKLKLRKIALLIGR